MKPSKQATPRNAVVLLSGGLDSATTLAIAIERGFTPTALSFEYGQRHAIELEASRRVAESMNVRDHVVVHIDLRVFGGSALTADIPVPKDHTPTAGEIPITYVPARNTIFLSYALALAEVREAADIFIGVNAVDYSGYPDCRPEYIDAFARMAALATRIGVEGRPPTIHAPLVSMTKHDIIATGLRLGVDYALTRSCYDPRRDGAACGHCDSCRLRLAAFSETGQSDPAPYA
ncbi:MAG: 7-cyano-7-deazaguanine synthase QueC [Phycisphaerales bacterium]|nr:7-cyano-7-deazaguanine synthase QueC [Phycisphaerales bacterium]